MYRKGTLETIVNRFLSGRTLPILKAKTFYWIVVQISITNIILSCETKYKFLDRVNMKWKRAKTVENVLLKKLVTEHWMEGKLIQQLEAVNFEIKSGWKQDNIQNLKLVQNIGSCDSWNISIT